MFLQTLNRFKFPITLVLLFLLAGWCYALIQKNSSLKTALKTAPEVYSDKPNTGVEKYFDRDSVLHVVYKDRIITPEQVKHSGVPKLVDSVAQIMDIKAKEISEVMAINSTLAGRVKALKVENDSLKRKTYEFRTKYLQAVFTENDSTLDYTYNSDITIVKHEKKTGFLGLGPTEYVTDISSPDSQMTFNGLKQYTIKTQENPKRVGLGLQIGGGYIPALHQFYPYAGLGLSYNFLNF